MTTLATGAQADYLARMIRSGTFELRVMVDSLAVCWRAVQVVAGPTCAPRCKISMEGLQGLHTGDTCRLTLKAADQYGNLRLDGNDAIQLTLEGPGGAFARSVQVMDHADGTYALEFVTPVAGRWTLSTRVNGTPCVEGGIAFSVAFGTLTAEEAVVRLVPSLEAGTGTHTRPLIPPQLIERPLIPSQLIERPLTPQSLSRRLKLASFPASHDQCMTAYATCYVPRVHRSEGPNFSSR